MKRHETWHWKPLRGDHLYRLTIELPPERRWKLVDPEQPGENPVLVSPQGKRWRARFGSGGWKVARWREEP